MVIERISGLFFSGTDTEVGKTYVTAAVARCLRRRGQGVTVCKPVATGASRINGRWRSPDTLRLAEAAGTDDLDAVTPYAFPEPVAPAVAARRHGIELTLEQLAAAIRTQARPGKPLLVEGVGGLLCPLTDRETVADLAAAVQMPLVIVARRSLGTLNHTLLTLEVARNRGLPVVGVIVNETAPPQTLADQTNVDELRRRIHLPILAVVPYRKDSEAVLDLVDWSVVSSQ